MKQDSQMDLSFANLKGKTVQAHFDGGTAWGRRLAMRSW